MGYKGVEDYSLLVRSFFESFCSPLWLFLLILIHSSSLPKYRSIVTSFQCHPRRSLSVRFQSYVRFEGCSQSRGIRLHLHSFFRYIFLRCFLNFLVNTVVVVWAIARYWVACGGIRHP